MILIGRLVSPGVRRVAVVCELLGLPYEVKEVSAITQQDEVRRYNPLGRVPALVLDDGDVLVESGAIIDHLLDRRPEEGRALLPATGVERRRVLKATALAAGATEKYVSAVYERNRKAEGKTDPKWIEFCLGQAHAGLQALEDWPPDPWLVGGRMTLADVTVAASFPLFRAMIPEFAPAGRYPRLEALCARCEATEAFRRTAPAS
jgi:glutathione S-transferase